MPAYFPRLIASTLVDIPLWAILPFVTLLGLIAVMPLTPKALKHFWEKYYPHIAALLGVIVVVFYVVSAGLGEGLTRTGHSLHEYFSFICLIGSLFVVSGGLHIRVGAGGAPTANIVLLLFGAVISNFIGTTGASMLLIRPFINMNKGRVSAYHIVFFIFIVSNVGGALTPIGDPPLFLGYLRGVPFWWLVGHAFIPWAFTIGLLLALFYILDRKNYRRALRHGHIKDSSERSTRISIEGLGNLVPLIVIIFAVIEAPAEYFVREIVMIAAAFASYKLTSDRVHASNLFTFGPIKEVAFLFFGIFLTMMPALDYLERHGKDMPINEPSHFYFATGALSSVLDNAPTYLNYFKLVQVKEVPEDFRKANPDEHAWTDYLLSHADMSAYIVAVSLGAVFFGAMTYIGNGPNFMVRSIAESAGVKMPSFFGYVIKYSVPYLLPILILVGVFFVGSRPPPEQTKPLSTPAAQVQQGVNQ